MSKYTVGGLFSGIGGLELAFQEAGFKISWSRVIILFIIIFSLCILKILL